jgi:hypothetical protein
MQMRLAFREEGNFWSAYVAQMGTMDGSFLLGSIMFGVVANNPDRKAAFMGLMKDAFADAVQDVTGKRPEEWDERSAPESERAGHG